MRRHRARRRQGAVVLPPIAVSPAAIDTLIDAGLLSAWDEDDPQAIAAAVEELLDSARPFFGE